MIGVKPNRWTIVELPAIAGEPDQLRRPKGEALWPSQYPLEALARIRANTLGLRTTSEDVFMWARAWDLAGLVEGDRTAGVLMARPARAAMWLATSCGSADARTW